MDWDRLAPINPCAVVGHHSENRIRPKGLLLRGLKKLAEGKVRIFHRILSFSFFGIFRYAALGVGVRLMIGNRKDGGKKGFVPSIQKFEFLNGARKKVFIANAPNRRKRRMLKMLLLDKAVIAVAQGKR